MLRGCRLQAKRCGVRAYGSAMVALTDCVLEDCGEQGAKAFDRAALALCWCARAQDVGSGRCVPLQEGSSITPALQHTTCGHGVLVSRKARPSLTWHRGDLQRVC